MKIIVVYDISDNGKRNKLANELKKFGLYRIQRSAFEGDIDS
ncbi:CRISPR-associated protein, Cas2 [Acidianus hospitalis W1]|nr:CRISPR-associated protein, Cas2 [Acidianus hospitalis W1]